LPSASEGRVLTEVLVPARTAPPSTK